MSDAPHDPIEQMEHEHEQMRLLYAQWRALCAEQAPPAQRQAVAEQLCTQLTIHARLEEELLDPLAREASALAPRAADEARDQVRDLLCRLVQTRPQDPLYEARVERLCEAIEAHIVSQREHLFPVLRRCGADLALLGYRLRERRRELEAVAEALREEVLVSAMA